MRKQFIHKNSIKFKWLCAYTIIFAVPVLASLIFFSGMSRKMYQQIAVQNFNVLERNMNELDEMFLETERICNNLVLDPSINAYINMTGNDKEKVYKFREIRDVLSRNTINIPMDKMIAVLYFRDEDIILTNDGMYDRTEFYDCFSDKSVDIDTWYDGLAGGDSLFEKMNFIFADNRSSQAIRYKKQIPYRGDEQITLIVNYNAELLLDNSSDISYMSDRSIIIENEKSNEIYAENTENISDSIKKKAATGKDKITKLNKYVAAYIPSRISGLKYTCFVPVNQFFYEYRSIRNAFILFTIAVFLIGFMIITVLLNINYAPIKKIIQKNSVDFENDENEFFALSKFINKNIKEKTELLAVCNENRDIVTEYVLGRLLTGEINSKKDINRMLEQQQIDIKQAWSYIVMFIRVENEDDFFSDSTMNSAEKRQMISFMIDNILGELFGQLSYKGYTVPIGEKIFYVIGGTNIKKQSVIDKFKYASEFFEEQFGICMSMSLSNVNNGYKGINMCFNQAVEGMNELVIYDNKDIVLYEDVEKRKNDDIKKTNDENELLISLLAKQNPQQIKEYIEFLFSPYMAGGNFSPHNYRVFRLQIIGVFLQAVAEYVQSDEERRRIQKDLMSIEKQDFSLSKTLLILKEVTDDMCCNNKKEVKNDAKSDVVVRVKNYIDNNYGNPDINVQILGEMFEISDGYLSHLFKQSMDVSIPDYVSRTRINKAKELLRDKRNTNEMIYNEVGFTNKSTFIRVFKRQTGMTPKQYRETIGL